MGRWTSRGAVSMVPTIPTVSGTASSMGGAAGRADRDGLSSGKIEIWAVLQGQVIYR